MTSSLLRGLSILTGVGLTLAAAPASADVEIAPMVVIDFTEFDGSGFNPEPAAGQLDSDDWAITLSGGSFFDFGGTAEGNGNVFAWGTSTGDEDDGGIWAFDVGGGLIGLGVQPTNNLFTPGQITLRLVNNTGADITEFRVEYSIWVNNTEARSNSLNLQESADHMTYNAVGAGFTSPEEADANGFTATEVVEVITPAAPIADGSQHYIAWVGDDAVGDSNERDEFAIEGITIRLLNVCGNGLMENEEACDDGLDNADTAACTSACVVAACGDGFIQEGVEECDDGNTDPDDGCAADCTTEDAGTSTGADTTAGETAADTSGSASDTDSDTDDTATGASMTDATATNPTTTSPTGGSDTDDDTSEGSGGEDDDTSGCSCNSSGNGAPIWGMVGLLGLAFARRRRS